MKNITKISLALLSGLIMAAAWPTNGFALLIFIAFVPLIYLQDVIGNNDNNIKGNIFLLSFLASQVFPRHYFLSFLTIKFLFWHLCQL